MCRLNTANNRLLLVAPGLTSSLICIVQARGKSGPLFTFDVHDDIRMSSDATLEKEDSHAGKVLLRHWYERNKHIFPASRWEPYDPTKTYTKYTVSDKSKKGNKWKQDSQNRSILVSVFDCRLYQRSNLFFLLQ